MKQKTFDSALRIKDEMDAITQLINTVEYGRSVIKGETESLSERLDELYRANALRLAKELGKILVEKQAEFDALK